MPRGRAFGSPNSTFTNLRPGPSFFTSTRCSGLGREWQNGFEPSHRATSRAAQGQKRPGRSEATGWPKGPTERRISAMLSADMGCQCEECAEIHAEFVRAFGRWPEMGHERAQEIKR